MTDKQKKEMGKLPCWEFKKCGHEKDGKCPAVTLHAGRSCWLVAGTLCGGKATGIFAQKIGDCKQCDFYIRGLCE
jgi:methyl-accepting chemotaxis protein